jgi:succinoglycan biosynthesis transport protein ExoP
MSSEAKNLHFKDYWQVVRNRWPIILTIFILVVGTAYFFTKQMPKIYSSSVLLTVDKKNPDLDIFEATNDGTDTYFLQTQLELIQSKLILYPVIDRLGLVDKWGPEKFGPEVPKGIIKEQIYAMLLRGYLNVQPSRNTKMIEIIAEDSDKEEAATLANMVATVYQNYREDDIRERQSAGMKTLIQEYEKQQKAVQLAKERVEAIRADLHLDISATSSSDAVTYQALDLQRKENQLSELRADYLARKERYDAVANLTVDQFAKVMTGIGITDTTIDATKQGMVNSEAALASLRQQGFGDQHDQVKAAMENIRELQEQLRKSVEGIRQGLTIDLGVSRSKLENLEKEVADQREHIRSQQGKEVAPYIDAVKELERQQQLLDILSAQKTQKTVSTEIGINPVMIVNHAEPGVFPIKPNMKLNLALSAAVGLLFGISLAYFIEYLDTSVKSLDDIERYLGTSVVGVIPHGVSTLNLEGPDSPNAEAYRIIRAKIDFGPKEDGASTMTVVSGGPGEGKSTTIFNLAFICANSGMMTLIVDADFRRHSVNEILGLDNKGGLADFLLGRGPITSYVRQTDIPNMHVITAGELPLESMGAMNPAKIAEAIQALRPYYHVVFFDAPPILGISDAANLVRQMDYTLMVVQHRRYPREVCLRVKRMVEEVRGNLYGVVLNNVHLKSDESYYYHTYYHTYYGRTGAQTGAEVAKRKKKAARAKKADQARATHETDDRF